MLSNHTGIVATKYRKNFKQKHKQKRKNKDIGTCVYVYDNNIVEALRRFKRRIEKSQILDIVRERQFYEKPSAKKRRIKKRQRIKYKSPRNTDGK